jgi:hypothetical protein
MQHVGFAQHTLARSRSRDRLIHVCLISLVMCTLLAGCAIGPRPGGYSCAGASGGCWTQLLLTHSHTDASGAPDLDGPRITGVSTHLLLAPLTCDDACRASTGDIAKPGFIATEVCLYDSDTKAWACTGYRTDAGGGQQYFVWYAVPGTKSVVVPLASTPPSPDAGKYAHAIVTITSASDSSSGTGVWLVFVESHPAGTSSYFVYDYLLPFNLSTFQPTIIQYTQLISGTSGATSGAAIFTNNMYGSTLAHDGASPTSLSPDWKVLQHDGVIPATGTATSPSMAEWAPSPSSSSYGGKFVVWCCTLV